MLVFYSCQLFACTDQLYILPPQVIFLMELQVIERQKFRSLSYYSKRNLF